MTENKILSPDSSQMACRKKYGNQKAWAWHCVVPPAIGRTAGPRLMTHASARIRQSSSHSRLLSAAGLPRRPTTHTMESLSSGSPHVTSQAGREAQVTLPLLARSTRWPVSTYLPTAAKPTTGPKVLVSSAGSGKDARAALRLPGHGRRSRRGPVCPWGLKRQAGPPDATERRATPRTPPGPACL
jgi:hypothetical protein